MKLYLVQHGKAKSKEEEPQRGLNKDGIAETIQTASFMYSTGPAPVEILYSDKYRARQTAELFAEKLINKLGTREHRELKPDSPVNPILNEIEDSDHDILIVGHLPFLPRLLSHLLLSDENSCPVQFRNSGVVCLNREGPYWQIQWIIHPEFFKPSPCFIQ
jgi:phosphohistidine phosphatase